MGCKPIVIITNVVIKTRLNLKSIFGISKLVREREVLDFCFPTKYNTILTVFHRFDWCRIPDSLQLDDGIFGAEFRQFVTQGRAVHVSVGILPWREYISWFTSPVRFTHLWYRNIREASLTYRVYHEKRRAPYNVTDIYRFSPEK